MWRALTALTAVLILLAANASGQTSPGSCEKSEPQRILTIPILNLDQKPARSAGSNEVGRARGTAVPLRTLSPGHRQISIFSQLPGTSQGSPPEPTTNPWSFNASVYTYLVPDSENYANPNFTADRGWLHLEARYNYEAQKAGSLWVGRNFSFGDKLALEVTPMVGGVFGDLNGIAPGYNLSLSYWKVELSSQTEYVFDLQDRSGNFFYTWSELTYSPVDWFRTGLVVQRTKAYETELDIQRGLLAGFSYRKIDFTGHVFNFGWTDPTVVLAVAVNF